MIGELKPCPFCGSSKIDPEAWARNDGVTGPGCDDCGASAESNEVWNRRAARDAEIERLKEALRECAEELESGLEMPGPMEAEHSIAARKLVARARAELNGEKNEN